MSYDILTYVRTGRNTLVEISKSGNRTIDVTKVETVIAERKNENVRNTKYIKRAEEDTKFLHDETTMDYCMNYFMSMPIVRKIPVNPRFDPYVVSRCGELASMGRS